LTETGAAILSKMHEVKRETLTQALSDWSEQDVADFARLYDRFMSRMHEQATAFDDESAPKNGTPSVADAKAPIEKDPV